MTLSICIPTYNRGDRALSLVEALLPYIDKYAGELEIVVSNNGSTKGIAEYEKIAAYAGDYLQYHAFSENQNYVGNFNQVIKMSRADWCLIVSDEDVLNEAGLDYYMNSLPQIMDIAIVRARTSFSYDDNREGFYAAGFAAMDEYFFSGNYISGIIYNRHFATNELIDELWNKYSEADPDGYFYYPHMFLDAVLLSQNALWRDNTLLVDEGEEVGDVERAYGTTIHIYATYEARLAQMKGFFTLLADMNPSPEIALKMMMRLLGKTAQYIGVKLPVYAHLGKDTNAIADECVQLMKQCVVSSPTVAARDYREQLFKYIDSLRELVL